MIKLCAPSEPFSSESPKVAEGARGDIYIRHQGSSFALTCRVQGFPVPEYRWVCREGDVSNGRGGDRDGMGRRAKVGTREAKKGGRRAEKFRREGSWVSKKGGGGGGGWSMEGEETWGKG